jgi:hypothetical protein
MRTLQSILGGLTAAGTILAVAWCYGVNFQVRGMDLGSVVMLAVMVGCGAGCAIREGGAK